MKELTTDFTKLFKGFKAKKPLWDVLLDIENFKSWLDASLYLDGLKFKSDIYNVSFEISNKPYNKVHKVKIKFISTDLEIKNKTITRALTLQ